MNTEHSLRHGKGQANEEDFFSLKTSTGDIDMHQVRVSSNDGTQLDGEFVGGRSHVIITEVEEADAGVAVESVDQVTGSLVRDLTVG